MEVAVGQDSDIGDGENMASTLTIRAIDPVLSRRLGALAKRRRKSLDQTVKDILAGHFGLPASAEKPKNGIMRHCGTLTAADARALHAAQAPFERIDPADWL